MGLGDTPPKTLMSPDSQDTSEMKKSKYKGTAVLFVAVDERGIPEVVQVIRAAPRAMDSGALASVASAIAISKFRPAMRAHKSICVGIMIQMNFRLY